MSKCRSRPACRLSKDETHHLTRAGCKKLFRTGSKGTDSVVNALLDPAVREGLRRSRDEDSASGEVKAAGNRGRQPNSFRTTPGTDHTSATQGRRASR